MESIAITEVVMDPFEIVELARVAPVISGRDGDPTLRKQRTPCILIFSMCGKKLTVMSQGMAGSAYRSLMV